MQVAVTMQGQCLIQVVYLDVFEGSSTVARLVSYLSGIFYTFMLYSLRSEFVVVFFKKK